MAVVSDILFGQFALQQGWVSQDILQGCLGEQSQLQAHGQACGLADLMAHRGYIDSQSARQLIHQISTLSFRCKSCASAWSYEQVANQEGFACLYCRNALDIQQGPASGVMADPSVRPVQNNPYILADSDSGSRIAYSNRPRSGPHQPPSNGQAPGPGGTQIIYSSNRGASTVKKETRFDTETFKSMGSKGKIVGSSGLLRNIDGRQFIGDFEVVDELGRGAMGVVYKVRNPNNGHLVALKLLLAGGLASETQIQRFIREAEITARLEHPVIVPIHDFGSIEGHPFFTMQFIEGKPLSTLIKRRKLGIRKSVMIARELARGLHYAHSQKVVHRDIKPANILIDSDLRPHLTDFGLARDIDEDEKQRLTRSGAVIGTPYYMAPEQVEGSKNLGPPCDVYALGVVLYQMLTFHLPFKAKSQIELSRMILKDKPTRPSSIESGVDKKLDAITLKALAKKPEHRYASAADMAADLDAYLAGESVMARSRGARNNLPKLLGITVAMLALVATGVFATILVLGPRENIKVSKGDTDSNPGSQINPNIGPKPDESLKAAKAIKRAKEKIHEARVSSDPELFSPLLKEAVTELTLAISLDESLSEAFILRGVARALLSEKERARKDLLAAGNDPMALFYLSRVIKDGEEGEGDKADKAFADIIHLMSQASRLQKDSVFVHLAKAFVVAFKNKEPNIALEMLEPLTTKYPDYAADVYLLKGYFQLKLNREDEALVSFNKVLRIFPNSQTALTNRCQLLMRLNDFSAALRDSERLTKLDPEISAAYAVQAQIHAAKKEIPQATRKFRRYLDLQPDDHQARLLYAQLLSREDKVSEAIIQAQRAIKQAPQEVRGYRLLSRIYHSHSRPLEGDEVTKQAIRTIKKPQIQWQLLEDLITEWVKRKRMDAVEKTCRERMRTHPHETVAHVLLGQAYFMTGKPEDGLELLKQAIKIDPESTSAYKNYLDGLGELGRLTEAKDVAKTMLAKLPGNAEALIIAADVALRTGEARQASSYIKQALASEPGNAKAKLRLASMSLARLEHNEVERLVGELVASEKTPRGILSEARTMLASSYAQRNRISLALEEATKAMQIDPDNPSPRGMLVKIFFNAKRFKQAYELCVNSTRKNILNADILDILGRIELFNNRDYKAALKAFKYVLAVRKNDPISYYFYALTLKRMGQIDAAKTFVDRGLQLDSKCEPLLKLKASFKNP